MGVTVLAALIGFVSAIIGAVIGAYLGARWNQNQFAQEQRQAEWREKRNYLHQWISDNHQKILYFDGCYDDASKQSLVTREEIDGLLNSLQILRIHFLDDPL